MKGAKTAVPSHVAKLVAWNKLGLNRIQDRRQADVMRRLTRYKYRAKNGGRVFDLTADDCRILMDRACFYCGLTPSNGIDRVDSGDGYHTLNVLPCCRRCNLAKNDSSLEDFVSWAFAVVREFMAKGGSDAGIHS